MWLPHTAKPHRYKLNKSCVNTDWVSSGLQEGNSAPPQKPWRLQTCHLMWPASPRASSYHLLQQESQWTTSSSSYHTKTLDDWLCTGADPQSSSCSSVTSRPVSRRKVHRPHLTDLSVKNVPPSASLPVQQPVKCCFKAVRRLKTHPV